jgi:hypothetical protein
MLIFVTLIFLLSLIAIIYVVTLIIHNSYRSTFMTKKISFSIIFFTVIIILSFLVSSFYYVQLLLETPTETTQGEEIF